MKHTVSHNLDLPMSKKTAEQAWEEYSKRYAQFHPACTWVSDRHADLSFSAKGLKVQGNIKLEEGAISFDIKVPLVLRVFQKQALEKIEREIRKWVEKAERGELT